MRFSHAALYAVRFLAHLAAGDGAGMVACNIVAGERGIPEVFLRRVLRLLARSGVLVSLRGRHGGYCLARPAKAITLLEVVEAIDGPLNGATYFGLEPTAEEEKLAALVDAASEAARDRLRKVRLSDLAGTGKE